MKFCSRCGLPLAGLASWVANGGGFTLPTEASLVSPSPRRKGIARGAKLLFLSAIVFPLFLALSFVIDSPVPLFIPFTIFLAGLSIMIYTRIFGEEIQSVHSYQVSQTRLGSTLVGNALPAAPNLPIDNVQAHRAKTAEVVTPTSVTEHTTKLLDKD